MRRHVLAYHMVECKKRTLPEAFSNVSHQKMGEDEKEERRYFVGDQVHDFPSCEHLIERDSSGTAFLVTQRIHVIH